MDRLGIAVFLLLLCFPAELGERVAGPLSSNRIRIDSCASYILRSILPWWTSFADHYQSEVTQDHSLVAFLLVALSYSDGGVCTFGISVLVCLCRARVSEVIWSTLSIAPLPEQPAIPVPLLHRGQE